MDKNFTGQNLNGRSFRGQDLRGADFSGCQLKSCDFRDTDLTGAKFCRATMGVNGQRELLKLSVVFNIGLFNGYLVWFFNNRFILTIGEIYKDLTGIDDFMGEHALLLIGTLVAASVYLSVFSALKYRDWQIVFMYCTVITAALMLVQSLTLTSTSLSIAVASGLALALPGPLAVVLAALGAGAGAVVIALLFVGGGTFSFAFALVGSVAVAVMTVIYLLLGWYLNRCTLQSEEPMLALLRRYTLVLRCWGGTQFYGATLAYTDFTEADLIAARFTDAKFHQPDFTRAKNLHLAWTYATPLERKPVRTLLTEHRIDERDFSNLNLRGLLFKDLNLADCNFYHADLSEADFSGCNLTNADLSEAMVLGARLNGATMTGAIIDNWSMDKQTQFDDVVCEYVYTQRDRSERNPPQGEFKPGEFSKLYQEIANTVDFIVHSPDELEALLRAIKSIKQQGGDLVIQSLERKNESVVVRTQSHDSIDKATVYAEVKEKAALEMNLLQREHEKQLLTQKLELTEIHHHRETELRDKHDSLLAQFINKAIENPKVEIMNDHSRHIDNDRLPIPPLISAMPARSAIISNRLPIPS